MMISLKVTRIRLDAAEPDLLDTELDRQQFSQTLVCVILVAANVASSS